MGRNLPFLPTCGSPSKTLSFRTSTAEFDDMFATGDTVEPSVESVIRGLSTDRFFFNPGKTSSILEEAKPKEAEKESVFPFKESVSMMEMESTDPFVDFKKSMQEMVDADEGLKEWENLQELLSWYLAVNDKANHGYIIGAFLDLLLANLGSPSKPSSSIKGHEQSLLIESGGSSCNNNNTSNNSNNKLTTMISRESPESALSFTSSFASSSGTCSSTSHFLSSCSLEDDEHGDDEDHCSPQKASVSDYPSSSLKV
ncbi:transcription repressor OFP15-like [Bidens hawaiensis]|uniref:transcription repressor OFP15-like n=1 Tax=Bidens hawaiensis TaxID=980011 RepID=UPI00404905CA